ncbi:hypothetical protein A2U01_0084007, partial [Trifolium medium]|nr:hypothetical protein [Trifolium medium]
PWSDETHDRALCCSVNLSSPFEKNDALGFGPKVIARLETCTWIWISIETCDGIWSIESVRSLCLPVVALSDVDVSPQSILRYP